MFASITPSKVLAGAVTALLLLPSVQGGVTTIGDAVVSSTKNSTGNASSMKSMGAPITTARPVSNNTSQSPPGITTGADGTVYTTEVVTAYTTYCPGPTQITQGGKTITVKSATTLTVTNCPCTILKPVTQGAKPPGQASTIPPGQISTYHGDGPTYGPQGGVVAWLQAVGLAAVLL